MIRTNEAKEDGADADGDKGDRGGSAEKAAVDDSDGVDEDPVVTEGIGGTCRAEGFVLRGGKRTL